MRDKYPDGVLDVKFQSIEDKLDEHFEATTKVLVDIKEQTTQTNGKVANINGKQLWQSGALFATGGFVMAIVVPLVGFLAYMVIQNSEHLAGIDVQLTQLEIKP